MVVSSKQCPLYLRKVVAIGKIRWKESTKTKGKENEFCPIFLTSHYPERKVHRFNVMKVEKKHTHTESENTFFVL